MIYTIMGICGWVAFYLSNSGALLLDGNYNLVNGISSVVGYLVVKIRSQKTATFPFGQYIYESLYSLVKGVLVLGILIASLWENSLKIYEYYAHGKSVEINMQPIAIYTVLMVTLSFGLSFYYRYKNSKIGFASSMLKTDTTTARIDGLLSLFAGGGLLAAMYIGRANEGLEFLVHIGDSLIVLLFIAIAAKEPVIIIRQNCIELAGGQLQSQENQLKIENALKSNLPASIPLHKTYITKTGSNYLVVVYLTTEEVSQLDIGAFKTSVCADLSESFSTLQVEVVVDSE
jgi:divalent metal cation (Fe/Co/Zn/Cd) transporter